MRAVRGEVVEDEEWCQAFDKCEWDQVKQISTAWVKKLVKCGDINVQDNQGLTALHHAARGRLFHRDEPCGTKGAHKHADPEPVWEGNPPPFPYGVEAGIVSTHPDPDIVELLLKHGSDPLIEDINGWSCIQHAVYYGHQDIAEKLQTSTQISSECTRNEGNVALVRSCMCMLLFQLSMEHITNHTILAHYQLI